MVPVKCILAPPPPMAERAGCFKRELVVLLCLSSCNCCVALPRDGMGLSADCNCGIIILRNFHL